MATRIGFVTIYTRSRDRLPTPKNREQVLPLSKAFYGALGWKPPDAVLLRRKIE
jgi:hypothetical protein